MKHLLLIIPLLLLLAFASLLTSCTDAEKAHMGGYGNTFKVEVVSGGQIIRTYTSTGKVLSSKGSDGYYFNDQATGKLTEVSGDVIITQLD